MRHDLRRVPVGRLLQSSLAKALLFIGCALGLQFATIALLSLAAGVSGLVSIPAWPAILLSAALFGVYHALGTRMWGMGLFFQIAMPAIGGVAFGWAAIRTGGLALPIGLHLGGNWVQASLVSLGPPRNTASTALWTSRLSDLQIQSLFAPDLTTHVPYLAVILTIMLFVQLRGRIAQRAR